MSKSKFCVVASFLTLNTYPFQGVALQAVNGIVQHRHKYIRCGAKVEFRCANINDTTGVPIIHLMRPHLSAERKTKISSAAIVLSNRIHLQLF